jgi:hypothetical protein
MFVKQLREWLALLGDDDELGISDDRLRVVNGRQGKQITIGFAPRCDESWSRPASPLCRPHHCDLLSGHKGEHICNCGVARRNTE